MAQFQVLPPADGPDAPSAPQATPPATPAPAPEVNPQPAPPAQPPAAPQADPKADQFALDQAAAKFTNDAGLDAKALSMQIAKTGDIDAESRAKLEAAVTKAGLPKEVVGDYIRSQKAAMDSVVNDVLSLAGGEEQFRAMGEWARTNLPPEDVKSFSDLCESGSPDQVKFAVKSLMSLYKANVRLPGKQVKGSTGPAGGDVFHNFEEQAAAQGDPRYHNDPAFRRQVEEKIERTFRLRRR